jgi:hypothetical protein
MIDAFVSYLRLFFYSIIIESIWVGGLNYLEIWHVKDNEYWFIDWTFSFISVAFFVIFWKLKYKIVPDNVQNLGSNYIANFWKISWFFLSKKWKKYQSIDNSDKNFKNLLLDYSSNKMKTTQNNPFTEDFDLPKRKCIN